MSKRSLSTQITRSKQMADNMALMLLGFKDYTIEGIEDVDGGKPAVPAAAAVEDQPEEEDLDDMEDALSLDELNLDDFGILESRFVLIGLFKEKRDDA